MEEEGPYNIGGGLFEAGSKLAAGRAEIHLRQNMSMETGLVHKV